MDRGDLNPFTSGDVTRGFFSDRARWSNEREGFFQYSVSRNKSNIPAVTIGYLRGHATPRLTTLLWLCVRRKEGTVP
jgi:hypothetical protein